MFHELEKMTLLCGWSYKYVLPQLIPIEESKARASFSAKCKWTNSFGSCRRKIHLSVLQQHKQAWH